MFLTFAGSLLCLTRQEKELLYAIAGNPQGTVTLDAYSPGFFVGFYDSVRRSQNQREEKGLCICR